MGEFEKRIKKWQAELRQMEAHHLLKSPPDTKSAEKHSVRLKMLDKVLEIVEEAKKEIFEALYPYLKKGEVKTDVDTLFNLEQVLVRWFGNDE